MEIINLEELLRALQDLGITLSRAKGFVDEGKEVYCSNKLQGALVKINNIIQYVNNFIEPKEEKDGNVVAQENCDSN